MSSIPCRPCTAIIKLLLFNEDYLLFMYIIVCFWFQQVFANGVIYIDSPIGECCPFDFSELSLEATPFIAPYWIDNDLSVRGNVSYEVHGAESLLLREVSDYISSSQNVTFSGTWMMVAYWWDVPELFLDDSVRQNTYTLSCICNITHVMLFLYLMTCNWAVYWSVLADRGVHNLRA